MFKFGKKSSLDETENLVEDEVKNVEDSTVDSVEMNDNSIDAQSDTVIDAQSDTAQTLLAQVETSDIDNSNESVTDVTAEPVDVVGQSTESNEQSDTIAEAEVISEDRIEKFTENLRITVAITDAYGNSLVSKNDADGESYVVSNQGTKIIHSQKDIDAAKKEKRKRNSIGLVCFFSIIFIALSVIIEAIVKNLDLSEQVKSVGTIFSSLAQCVAYAFLAIHGFQWINTPNRHLAWKIIFWISIILVFVALVVGTTLAFVNLGAKTKQEL